MAACGLLPAGDDLQSGQPVVVLRRHPRSRSGVAGDVLGLFRCGRFQPWHFRAACNYDGSFRPPVAGWQLLSPYDTTLYGDAGHEIVKQLSIAPGSSQTDGEYGFAFTVTAHFAGGLTVTSGPLVDIFALGSTGSDSESPFLNNPGLQDQATLAPV